MIEVADWSRLLPELTIGHECLPTEKGGESGVENKIEILALNLFSN